MTMQIVRAHSYGGPEVLAVEELKLSPPGPGQALVEIAAAAVTFYDVCNRRGDFADRDYYKDEAVLPLSPGYQGAGVVVEVGPDVTDVRPGDRVVWIWGSGAYATHVVVPTASLIPVPDDIDMEQMAGALIQAFVALKLTSETYPVAAGEWCLVQSAAGGVGSLLCQMAKLRGAKVIGVASTEEKAAVAREAGADEVIVSTTADVPAEVKRITGGPGVRVVYDGVGKDTFDDNLDSIAPRGYLIVYGQSSGFVPPLDLMTLQNKGSLYLNRFTIDYYFTSWPDQDYLEKLYGWMRSGDVSVRIDRRYPLEQAAEAHAAVEFRKSAGRVLLVP
ncbi:quinone oxidoreductase [Phytohabitans flavus]|uniref:Alcohol dehydrogenase n=1 Tax=Phytohabitans flavus TaxID=1076124 RepID=A0A6F8XKQ1_9ACTN|nr:quinone oxidoreductase [Phytohabitans flavus]BCB74383.1 alcohol dehydrogenase [Phytohabitans flavus]